MYVKVDFAELVLHAGYMTAAFWRVLTTLAVPSFVMLSGAFILKDENSSYASFYPKVFRKIIIPTLIFSIIYVLMHYSEIFLASILHINVGMDKKENLAPIVNWIKGKPSITMWYMYMIIPLYIITPVIVMIKKSLSVKSYRILAFAMLIYGILVSKSCSLSWILQYAEWIGYFLMGDVIKEWGKKTCNLRNMQRYRVIGIGLIAMAYVMLVIHWYVCTYQTGEILIPESFSWIVIIAVLLQFAGFSLIQVKKRIRLIEIVAKYSFDIYLIHPIICEICMQLFGRIFKWFPNAVLIPVYSLAIMGVSVRIVIWVNHLKLNIIRERIELWK